MRRKGRRLWALLMSLCLTLSVLPATALAGGLETVKTYSELREKLASQTGTIYVEPSENFGWPETGALTIRANTTIRVVDNEGQKTAWEIPDGITVNFGMDCRGIQCTELTINGTMHMAYSSQDAVLRDCDKVIIGPTGTFSCEDDNPAYPTTVYTVYIPAGQTWEVQAGGTLNPGVRLDGTLTGSGTVSGAVSARGGLSSEASNGILSGTLTLTGSVEVGQWNSGTYADSLTIPAGSRISFQPAQYGSILINENATLILNGQLDISGSRSGRTNGISLQNTGELQMGAGSVLSLHYPYELSWSYQEDVPQPTDPLVTGSGTIQYHADDVSQLARYCLFYRDITGRDMSFETACEGLFPAYIENGVTLWRSWACDHIWDDGEETEPATCTEPGERTYTCTKCGATRMEALPATGHTEVIDEAEAATCTEEGKTQGSHCSVCNAVIVAQETTPALGHLWSTNDCTQAATCTREGCDATRAAGEHVWGDWIEDEAATCTEEGSRHHTCSSCGASESQSIPALGHDYQSAVTAPTCTEQGYTTHTCSRCGNSYQDSETDALGHDWGQWEVTKPTTETEDGSRARTCQRCGVTETETISKWPKQALEWPYNIGETVTYTYGAPDFQAQATNNSAGGGDVTYTSSNTDVAAVDSNGLVTIKNAGTTTITATAAAVTDKYAKTEISYTLVIKKASLTITANEHAITYGQAPANGGYTASGFVKGENDNVLDGTAVYACAYQQFGKAGEYAISASGLTAKNYDITFVPGKLTVHQAADYTITLGKLEQSIAGLGPVSVSITPQDSTARFTVEYQIHDAWTTELPTKAGSYSVRAVLTASDNLIPSDAKIAEGILVIQNGAFVDTGTGNVSVDVDVKWDQAEVTLPAGALDQILANTDGDTAIDLGNLTGVKDVTLPGDLLDGLAKGEGSLAIRSEDAAISMSDKVLDTIADAVTGPKDKVTLRMSEVNPEDMNDAQKAALASLSDAPAIVDLSLVITHADGTTTTLRELNGNVEVTIPYTVPAGMEGQNAVACYISAEGYITYIRAKYENGAISFHTNHFSNYAVFVSQKPAVIVTDGSGSGLYAMGETVTITADSRSGYRFDRWEVVSDNVTLANANSVETTFLMPGGNVEITAIYDKVSTGGGGGSSITVRYAVSAANTENGTITAQPQRAVKGDTVTLTVKPDEGYKLDSLTVTDRNGKEIRVTGKNGKYTFTMPASKVTVKATFIKNQQPGETVFTDVPADAYYAEAVQWAVAKGITAGTSATTFSPESGCTRGQIVTFLWRAAGSPVVSDAMGFTDVAADAYYAEAVRWAVAQGITAGTSTTTFSPESVCTRGQIMTFLFRANGQTATTAEANPFPDVAVDSYYYDAILWAAENGITAGTSATTFSPDAACTRGQIMTFLFRAMGK